MTNTLIYRNFKPLAADADGDGISDAFDPDAGGTYLTPVNTDGTGNPDYLDLDSDDDGVGDNSDFFPTDSERWLKSDTQNPLPIFYLLGLILLLFWFSSSSSSSQSIEDDIED